MSTGSTRWRSTRTKRSAAAYKALYGKDIQTEEASATAAWVKALAANAPLLTDADAAAARCGRGARAIRTFHGTDELREVSATMRKRA